MRLNRLDLIRYGKFAEAALDFGPPGRAVDVTVIYGENEAGKSTAFAAWLDLLFGLDLRHPYAFRFERSELMVGAEIETPSGPLTLRRTGKRDKSLTDADGHAVAETRLQALLCGLDRDAYRTRFSLDDAVLRDGGAEIARAGGDLGRLLHAGSSGISGLSAALDAVEEEVRRFHVKGARKSRLAEAKRRIKEHETALRERRLAPQDHARLVADRDAAEAQERAAEAAVAEARRACALRGVADERRAVAAEIARTQDALADLPGGPDLPPDAAARAAAIEERLAAADTARRRAERARRSAEDALAEWTPDPAGLEIARHLALLKAARLDDGSSLVERAGTGSADLEKRRRERAETQAELSRACAAIGADPAAPPILDPSAIEALRAAAQAVREAEKSLGAAQETRADMALETGEPVAPPQGLAALEDALEALEREPADAEGLAQAAEAAQAELRRAAVGLPQGWRAVAEAGLAEEPALAALADAVRLHRERAGRLAADVAQAEAELRDARARREAAEARPDTVTDAALAQSRDARDAAWRRHRAALDAATADAFEAAMQADDTLHARHAAGSDARAQLAARIEEEAVAAARHDTLRRREKAAEADRAEADAAARAAALALGLPGDADAAALLPRRAALHAAFGAALRADEAARLARTAAERRSRLQATLVAAIAAIAAAGAEPPPPARLLPEARRLRAALRDAARKADLRAQALANLERQDRRIAKAAADRDAARGALADLARGTPCEDLDAAGVLERLPVLGRLATLDDKLGEQAHRIAGIEAAIAGFEAGAAPLRDRLDLQDAPPGALLAAAEARAEQAQEAARAIETAQQEIGRQAEATAEAEAAHAAASGEGRALLAGQAVAEDAPLGDAVARLRRRDDVRAALRTLKARHAELARGWDGAALAAEEADPDPGRLPELEAAESAAQEAHRIAMQHATLARHALQQALGQPGGAETDQARAAELAALAEDARLSAARLLGLMAARSALRRFRESRRGPMLEAAEHAFARLTRGEWPRLETRSEGAGERLLGCRAEGDPVPAEAMSTGTRGQLYLALRIAGHADFVAGHGPLPFVTDDILETFDDGRATAALTLAADMGQRGQVVLFTHHRHLVDLAREAIPDLRVIEMPAE